MRASSLPPVDLRGGRTRTPERTLGRLGKAAIAWAAGVGAVLSGCAPRLAPPHETLRIRGVVQDSTASPVEVEVYERCSPQLVFFERCPGDLLARTRLARPGPFLLEIDPKTDAVSVIAFRGAPGAEEACAVQERATRGLATPFELALSRSPCPVKRPEPPRASARAPISAY